MTGPTLFSRLRQQERVDALQARVDAQHATLTRLAIDERVREDLDDAVWQWLQARIVMRRAADSDVATIAGEQMTAAGNALDQAARKALMRPGLNGSWGRDVPRDWACGFDPQNGGPTEGGCECSGHGRDKESSSGCYYRFPVGEKHKRREGNG